MLKNLVNRHDLHYLVNGLRTGSIWRTLKRLVRGSESAVKATWQHVDRPPTYLLNSEKHIYFQG